MARLGDVVKVEPSHDTMACEKQWLLNLDMVEQQTGRVLGMNYVDTDSLTGSIIHFDTSMVLYSKLRPNLNKVVLPMQAGYATSEMLPLKPNESVLSREYLTYYLRSDSFVTWAVSKTAGAKMPRLGTRELLEKEIQLPSLCEQHLITQVFSKLDSLVQLEKQQLTKLDELVKSRFIELFGDPIANTFRWKQALLREVTSKIGSGATPRGGKESYQAEGVNLIRSMNVHDGRFEYKDLAHITEEQAAQLDNVTVKGGDVFINITGASVARSCIVPKDALPARVNQHVAIIRCLRDRLHPAFANNMFRNDRFKGQLLDLGEAGGATRQAITKQQLENLTVILPPLALQEQFAAFVEQTDKSKLAVKQSLEKLETLKKSLMQQYFG